MSRSRQGRVVIVTYGGHGRCSGADQRSSRWSDRPTSSRSTAGGGRSSLVATMSSRPPRSCVGDDTRPCVVYLDFKTASTIAKSIVHSKLDYCNSLCHNLPKSQIDRLQVIQNFLLGLPELRLPNSVTSPLFSNLHIGLKSVNVINTNFFLLPTNLLPQLLPTYLHSLISVQPLVVLVPHLLSPCFDHLHLL